MTHMKEREKGLHGREDDVEEVFIDKQRMNRVFCEPSSSL
jgi:hypothetical protein